MTKHEPDDGDDAKHAPILGTWRSANEVELPGGRVLDLSGLRPPPGKEGVRATLLDVIEPCHFDRCPICLSAEATTAEHVPPQALGGRELTATCADCNNRFGPVEAELVLHTRNAARGPGFSGDPVRGRRRARGLAVSFQEDGSPVFVVEQADPAVREMLQGGRIHADLRLPDPARWRTALLKHAYLAACVYLQAVPQSPHAAALRDELVRARDAGIRHALGDPWDSLPAYRGYGDPLASACLVAVEVEGQHRVMVGLGRYGAVGWPIPDQADALRERLIARLPPRDPR